MGGVTNGYWIVFLGHDYVGSGVWNRIFRFQEIYRQVKKSAKENIEQKQSAP